MFHDWVAQRNNCGLLLIACKQKIHNATEISRMKKSCNSKHGQFTTTRLFHDWVASKFARHFNGNLWQEISTDSDVQPKKRPGPARPSLVFLPGRLANVAAAAAPESASSRFRRGVAGSCSTTPSRTAGVTVTVTVRTPACRSACRRHPSPVSIPAFKFGRGRRQAPVAVSDAVDSFHHD